MQFPPTRFCQRRKGHIKAMKKYIFSTLVAMTLACGAYAGNDNGNNGNGNNGNGNNGNGNGNNGNGNGNGQTHSVPDAGSTAALLGLSLAVVGLTRRKWASSLGQRR
jgi:VPDSG-CTERM motif